MKSYISNSNQKVFLISKTQKNLQPHVTNPELKLIHIRHAKEIKSYLLKASEAARIKRRTMHTIDIGAHDLEGHEDLLDDM